MSAPTVDTANLASQAVPPALPASTAARPVRPFYWSVRRELWEHRSLFIAPTAVAAVVVLALMVAAFKLPSAIALFDTLAATKQREIASAPYAGVALVLTATAMIVAMFYCLDALFGERRDRSVLFWKSMPIADRTAVLAKLAVPMLAVPAFVWGLIVVTQALVLVGHLLLWGLKGMNIGMLLQRLPLLEMPFSVAYLLVTQAIWYAPVYAWLLLVSAWAQRSPLAWAVVPWIAVTAVEQLMLRTSHAAGWWRDRLFGGVDAAFSGGDVVVDAAGEVQRTGSNYAADPARFLSNPQVWLGIAIAVALIAATIWLRRRQESVSA